MWISYESMNITFDEQRNLNQFQSKMIFREKLNEIMYYDEDITK